MRKNPIPVAAPMLIGNERAYVTDCLESTWISSCGKYVGRFETAFANFCGVKYALSCCNGTAALHLVLMAFGVGPGDEVIVPTLTFVATANAVTYCGAKPVFVDSDLETWNIDPLLIEKKITPRTKGIIVVHLYGNPCEMDMILEIAHRHSLFVIEDAAEVHGAEYKGRKIGSTADAATFSFYGNKIVTCGEGGMVVTNNDILANKIRQLKGQGVGIGRHYWFPMIGYNYRLSNLAAAIGLAQLEKIDWHIQRRIEIARYYYKELQGVAGLIFQKEKPWAKHVYWMFNVLLDESIAFERDELIKQLYDRGIETRPIFYPLHILPPYKPLGKEEVFSIADRISQRGITLPTWAGLTERDIKYICGNLRECLDKPKR